MDEETVPPVKGLATSTEKAEGDTSYYVAHLWLPDPDTRRGWRMVGVDQKKDSLKPKRLGF